VHTRTRRKYWILCAVLASALIVLVLSAAIGYRCRISLFDRSGWQGTQYLDYDGNPVLHWQEIDGKTYYFDSQGNCVTGWLRTKYGTFYLEDGGGVHTGWLEDEKGSHYFGEDGRLCTGWTEIGGEPRFLDEDGVAYTGWLEQEGDRLYLQEGVFVTGWQTVDGKNYYFRENGAAATGQVVIDGKEHFFSSRGEEFVFVNAWHMLPEDYQPELVLIENEMYVDASCAQAVKTLLADLRALEFPARLSSAHRDVQAQIDIWWEWYERYINAGENEEDARRLTDEVVAKPGTSEHHTGLAVDIAGGWPMFDWLAEHCVEYGFTLRFPEGKEHLTGITYEPWHFRYVGVEMAKELQALDMCLEEYVDFLSK